MKIIKLISFAIIVLFIVLLATSCGNRQIIDTYWEFNKAKIIFGDEVIEVDIDKWRDYEGDAVQIVDRNGNVYVTSYVNVLLMSN